MIVAIDGPAGSGKSTVARALSRRLGFRYLDTGAMYRALTWLALEHGVPLDDEEALADLARVHHVSFGVGETVDIDDVDVTIVIREPRIDAAVPVVARHPAVRAVMRGRQRSLAVQGDCVMEGRDIGTVVAPDADVKVYLVADPAERARRRHAEREGIDAEALAEELRRRDERDAVNMEPAADAVEIDTTALTIEEVVERIAQLAAERRGAT